MDSFDEKAKTWDQNPVNWERSEAIAKKIQQKMVLNPEMVAMENKLSYHCHENGPVLELVKDSIGKQFTTESQQDAKTWVGENNYEMDGNVYLYNIKKTAKATILEPAKETEAE